MTHFDNFLLDYEPRPWSLPDRAPEGFTAQDMFLGRGDNGIEVACATWSGSTAPAPGKMRTLWSARHGGAASPLLLIAAYQTAEGARAALCGPVGEQPPVQVELDLSQVERIAEAALKEPSRHLAIRFLSAVVPEAGGELVGLRNQGMFATHALRGEVRALSSWNDALGRGRSLLTARGRDLLQGLGFGIEQLDSRANVLTVSGNKRAVAVLLEEHDNFEETSDRFNSTTPVSFAMALAERENLPWVVLTRGQQIRVYSARPDVGVGRKGRSETFVEANLALVAEDDAGYLPLLFGADALADGGTFHDLLTASERFAGDLGQRLRERVYNEVVPDLALAIAHAHHGEDTASLTEEDLEHLYEQTLLVLFRTLFVAYAEDRSLLPYDSNGSYRENSLKALAQRLARTYADDDHHFDAAHSDLWNRLNELWTAVDRGHTEWGVPAYNGGMFSINPDVSRAGADLASITLDNAAIGNPLRRLLVNSNDDGSIGALDFRSLSVREFGTIYEGLLESSLSVAPSDLVLDASNHYVPAPDGAEPTVTAGGVYFHNRSGERKSTGSYFTKPFAVEYLLDSALKPALDRHLADLRALLDDGDEAAAAERFFDFRCVDLSMGSGHFLVAAVDRIEAALSDFLATHPIPLVSDELHKLRTAALEHLGPHSDSVEIETTSLLRRQVARRCIYGIDLNLIAVELSRLAMWIHTFVPGLPLSFLDHSLVVGDSLLGIGTLDELKRHLTAGRDVQAQRYVSQFLDEFLESAAPALRKLATVEEAHRSEIAVSRELHAEAINATAPIRDLCDLLLYSRHADGVEVPNRISRDTIISAEGLETARTSARKLGALHFPVAFPEVFLRDKSGFDCILGNPPWDKVRHEPRQFWATRFPGLNSLDGDAQELEIARLRRTHLDAAALEAVERERREVLQAMASNNYRLQGAGRHGHHEFAKLFLERALDLGSHGSIGLVLPRPALVLGGWTDLREAAIRDATVTAVPCRNRGGWLFDGVHGQQSVVLLTRLQDGGNEVHVHGGAANRAQFERTITSPPIAMTLLDIEQCTDRFVIPWFNSTEDREVFERLLGYATITTGWPNAEVDASRWDFSGSGRNKDVVGDPGECEWGVLMARHIQPYFVSPVGIRKGVTDASLLVSEDRGVQLDDDGTPYLGAEHPSIVVRYPSGADNSRTMIAAPLPVRGYFYSKGYASGILVPLSNSDDASEWMSRILALTGYLNTFTCDWWSRRFVDRHVTPSIIKSVPVPDWDDTQRLQAAALVNELMRRHGATTVAGCLSPTQEFFETPNEIAQQSDRELRAEVERLALEGFGLNKNHYSTMLDDFNERAEVLLPDEVFGASAPVGAGK